MIGTTSSTAGQSLKIDGGLIDITNWVSSSGAYDKFSLTFGESRGFGYDPFLNQFFIGGAISVPFKIDTDAPTDSFNILSTGEFGIGTSSPTDTLDVNGTTRIRSIANLGSTPTEVLVPSATGVVSKRTLTEFKSDLGLSPISGLTTNRLTKVTSSSTIGDSILIDDANGVYNTGKGNSTFFGFRAGLNDDGTDNANTFVGYNAGFNNTTGASNSFFGLDAGLKNTEGSSNSFFG